MRVYLLEKLHDDKPLSPRLFWNRRLVEWIPLNERSADVAVFVGTEDDLDVVRVLGQRLVPVEIPE